MTREARTGRVAEKIAFVTGAGSGIGRATALTLAAHGAFVACADINLRGATATVLDIGKHACAYQLDVTDESTWETTITAILNAHGRLDIVVNCAGISFGGSVPDMSLADWRRVMAVNLDGVFLGTKHAIRAMRLHGGSGSIINVASVSGLKAQPEASAYCASKAAVIHFSKSAALECARRGDGIRVNCISPTGVKTPMWQTMPFFQELIAREGSEDAAYAAMAQGVPHARWALPEEVALAILYLASDESAFITGTNLVFVRGDSA